MSDDENNDEELDPRVEGALGELNTATDDINKSEKDLEASKKAFKQAMQQVQIDLAQLVQKIGKKNIDKARPYHNALYKARKAHFEARRAAQAYEQASGSQRKHKTNVAALEKELMKGGTFNPNLQQKLNQATQSVMEADKRKRKAAEVHSKTTQNFLEADEELMNFAKTRKKIILKTQPYFSCKEKHDKVLLKLKEDLLRHEAGVKSAKARVAAALKTLETISLEIHEARKKRKEEEPAAETDKTDSVTQAIAKAQEDAVAREKAEQERLEQEEAERKAEEEAAAAAAAAEAATEAAEAAAEEPAEGEAAAVAARNPDPASAEAKAEEGASDSPVLDDEVDEDDESDALNDSVDISEEDLRNMIQKKLDEDEVISPDTTIEALIDSANEPPLPLDDNDDDGADPITV